MAKPIRHRNKWRVRPLDANGNRLSRVFDTYREADNWAKEVEVEAEQIRQGLRRKTDPSKTFDHLDDYWLKFRNSKKKNPKDDESILRAHLRPFFGGMPLIEITSQKVDEFKATEERAHLSNGTWFNILKLLISMLHQAVKLKWLLECPEIIKPSIADVDFKFLHDKRMIRCFLDTARDYGEHAYAMYATAFYTGMRQGEIAGLHWSCVDLERRLITVRQSFSSTTKSKKIRRVPILNPLLPILREWRLQSGSALVFPSQRGTMYQPSARIFQERFQMIQTDAIERMKKIDPALAADWPRTVFHDTRHAFASHWMMDGGNIFKLQKILGHASIETTMRYSHLAPEAFVEDYDRMDGMIPNAPGTVVDLADRRSR